MSDEKVTFICPSSASLVIGVDVNGVRKKMQFERHALTLSGADAEGMYALLAAMPKLKLKIQVADKHAAESLVKQHMANNKLGGPISGGMHSGHGHLESRDESLRSQGVTDEGLAKLQDDISKDADMLLTEKSPVAHKASELAEAKNVTLAAKPEPKVLGGIKLG